MSVGPLWWPWPRPRCLAVSSTVVGDVLLTNEEQTSDQRWLRPHSSSMSAGQGWRGRGRGWGWDGNGAVNHSCPVIVGEILCLSGHFLLPLNGDVASFMCASQLWWNLWSDWTGVSVIKLSLFTFAGTVFQLLCWYAVVTGAFSHRLFQRPLL